MGRIDKNLLNSKEYKNAKELMNIIINSGFEIYLVGGCVRDMVMGSIPKDYDMCTNADPYSIIKILVDNNIKFVPTGIEFGTVVVHYKNEEFEITTYREEKGYYDARHPNNTSFVSDIKTDLFRRDFTINSMAYNPFTEELLDLFGGVQDIKDKKIKAVGDPNEKISEDSLRILRAIRFAIVYNFDIEDNTNKAIVSNVELLDCLSKERITSELEKILTSGKPVRDNFIKYDCIISKIFPQIKQCIGFDQNNKYHLHNVYEHMLYVTDNCKSSKFEIKLAALLHDIGKPKSYSVDDNGHGHSYGHPEVSKDICEKMLKEQLRLTNEQYDRVITLIEHHDMMMFETTGSVKRALNKFGEDFLNDWFILKQADIDDHINLSDNYKYKMDINSIKKVMQDIIKDNACFKLRDLKINGKDIMRELGLKPGKQVGNILQSLLDNVIDNKINNDYQSLLDMAIKINKK